MQARRLVCQATRQVGWERYQIPDALEPDQLLIESAASLISAGTEIAIYSGSHIGYTLPNPPAWLNDFPISLGYALAGTVRAVGREVQDWAAGDRVLAHLPHGDWAVCRQGATLIRPVPPGVSMAEAALARLGAISLGGVRPARLALGEMAVVFGLGLIGQFAARLGYLSGARPVIGVDLIPDRLRLAEAGGIQTVDPSRSDLISTVRQQSGGRMAEIVIEATGNPRVMSTALEVAAEGGRVVLLGSLRGKIEIDAYSTIHRRGIALLGAHDRLSDHPETLQDPWTRPRNLDLILSLFADGSLTSEGLISHRIRPDQIGETYEQLIERPGDFMGVLIDWEEE